MYLGKMKALDMNIAFKQFSICNNAELEKKAFDTIQKEINIYSKLSHKNIVKYFTVHKSNISGIPNQLEYNVIMEYLPGGSLAEYIKENATGLSMKTIKSYMR